MSYLNKIMGKFKTFRLKINGSCFTSQYPLEVPITKHDFSSKNDQNPEICTSTISSRNQIQPLKFKIFYLPNHFSLVANITSYVSAFFIQTDCELISFCITKKKKKTWRDY